MTNRFFLLVFAISILSFTFPVVPAYEVGDLVENFTLKNVDGKMTSLYDFTNEEGIILVFTCNTCPVSQAYEQRIIDLHKKYRKKGFPVIAINPNDVTIRPGDSYDAMVDRAIDKDYSFHYLHDEDQEIAMRFGAAKTPHVYLLQNVNDEFKIAYIGSIDDNSNDETAVTRYYLEDAIAALQAGNTPDPAKTVAIGCSIKWRVN